ncbi:nodulation protein noeI- methyltransferase [Polymorphobacter multimanifer]|uniref:FkbM family methyltransferase n=1 Tax=Polymorphobacter multimanifer TaxID=1070431 RepID=A0A841L293_9SPHN|nr:FkbM family methyltransferase [Polymorphobacter multimanifer]MBB6226436.1 FkbM family methyltransferase [Polymorphobacter multimanifer]GGI67608.1 nodulation protein noeI- methyltransferase [Polymorphobacter multimanifer]
MQGFLKRRIVENRRSAIVRYVAGLSRRFLNAYHYTGEYAFATNGEKFALSRFAQAHGSKAIIWDVGAHLGEYALEAHDVMPEARIVSFEIIPEIAAQLKTRITEDWFELHEIGLSNAMGNIEVSWNRKQDTTNAVVPFAYEHLDLSDVQRRQCPITTIDRLIAEGHPPPDVLKIDVEGHEAAVLNGAGKLLASDNAPTMIQFEYGGTWIPSSATLYAAQACLEGFGYAVGRLYPDHVAFKRYSWQDEHFRMGNMIAARGARLRKLLSN